MDKETVNEPRKWRPWLWFCVCIGIVTMVSIGGFAWLNNVNAEKQERIVELYRVHTHERALNNAKARCVAIDSIVRKYPAKDGERAIAVLESEIRKDEVGCNNEVLRHLLELEHNRIQEEYENLALWAGIITVVFLIFSFYSIFRGEELNRRASESIKELDSIKANAKKKRLEIDDHITKGETSIDQRISKATETLRNNVTTETTNLNSAFTLKLTELNKKSSELLEQQKTAAADGVRLAKNIENSLKDLYERFQTELRGALTQIANVADQRLNAIQSGENAGYAELLKRIKSIEDQLDHVPLFTFEENDDDEVTLRLTDRNEQKEAEDMGNFYRVPADNRDLNYDKYFKEGDDKRVNIEEFNSNNTRQLDVAETREKIASLEYIQNELSGSGNFVQ